MRAFVCFTLALFVAFTAFGHRTPQIIDGSAEHLEPV